MNKMPAMVEIISLLIVVPKIETGMSSFSSCKVVTTSEIVSRAVAHIFFFSSTISESLLSVHHLVCMSKNLSAFFMSYETPLNSSVNILSSRRILWIRCLMETSFRIWKTVVEFCFAAASSVGKDYPSISRIWIRMPIQWKKVISGSVSRYSSTLHVINTICPSKNSITIKMLPWMRR